MDTLRILVVDDEPGIRHSIPRALRNHRIELPEVESEVQLDIECVASGEEALDVLAERTPDLMLLDHKMGGMSGLEVLERIRDRPIDLLVIMVTAFGTIETAVRATKSGAFDFLTKPFTPAELKSTVHKAVSHLVATRQARKLAEEKRRVRFEFIRVLGHELKAPLGAIESYLRLLQSRTAGDDLSSYDQIVERCLVRSESMRKLIVDLLDMTRIESGEKKRSLGQVDVAELARSVADGASFQASERSISIDVDLPEEAPMVADPGEIEIVLNNLVSNAIKYNRDGGSVHVRVAATEDRITLAVRDTGIGLSAEEADRLFRDFVRIKNPKTRNILGSGLGLSIVRKIADLYRGAVNVESRPDEGSQFSVELERWPAADTTEATP